MFQSLFYWNLLSYWSSTRTHTDELWVSILVLLEPPLILRNGNPVFPYENSFNPCFTGTSSHTLANLFSFIFSQASFNPCFTGTSSHTSMLSIIICYQ